MQVFDRKEWETVIINGDIRIWYQRSNRTNQRVRFCVDAPADVTVVKGGSAKESQQVERIQRRKRP